MSMFNETDWTKKGCSETCLHNAKEVAAFATPFKPGHSCLLVLSPSGLAERAFFGGSAQCLEMGKNWSLCMLPRVSACICGIHVSLCPCVLVGVSVFVGVPAQGRAHTHSRTTLANRHGEEKEDTLWRPCQVTIFWHETNISHSGTECPTDPVNGTHRTADGEHIQVTHFTSATEPLSVGQLRKGGRPLPLPRYNREPEILTKTILASSLLCTCNRICQWNETNILVLTPRISQNKSKPTSTSTSSGQQ